MGYILLCLLVPGAVAGNKNNKEINTAPVYTTVSLRVTNKKYTPSQSATTKLDGGRKISRKLFDLCGAMGSSHIMTQMVVDIFRPKYLHPPSC